MKTKQLFFNSISVCAFACAVLLSQAMFNISATAENSEDAKSGSLLQRVQSLEKFQEEGELDFFLIDQSLSDLDMRVNENEARGLANKRAINELDARYKKAIAVQQADKRGFAKQLADLRALISKD